MQIDEKALLDVHERAIRTTVDVVAAVRPEDLAGRTPCEGWDLAQLLAHMTVQHHGFAASAAGGGGDLDVWQPRPLADDPSAAYAEAADAVLAAFAREGVLDQEFALPEFGPDVRVPAPMAIGAHLVDYVVHGWDVARSLARAFEVDEDVAAAALQVAEQVPDGAERLEPGAPFRPALAVPATAGALERTLLLLGRSPKWPH